MFVDKEQLDNEISLITTDDIKSFTKKILNSAPDYFWNPQMGASSSGKYHKNLDGSIESLIEHTKRVVYMMAILLNNPIFGKTYSPIEKDCMYSACILHDCVKRGFDLNDLTHTKFRHPMFIRELCKKVYTVDELQKMSFLPMLLGMIESHSGLWNIRQGEASLPTPNGVPQLLVHLSDYISSRKGVYIDLSAIDYTSLKF